MGQGKLLEKRDVSSLILRLGVGLVFLYFGFSQLSSPLNWIGFVPEFLPDIGLSLNNIVVLNGFFEIIFALFLIIGLYVRSSGILLSLHLFFTSFSIGFNPVGVRDFGLAVSTLVIFLIGPDKYCIDNKFSRKGI